MRMPGAVCSRAGLGRCIYMSSIERKIRRAAIREGNVAVAALRCPKCGRVLKNSGIGSNAKCRHCGMSGRVAKK